MTVPQFKQVQYQFAAHLRDPEHNKAPGDIEDRRMEIYRDLIYKNIEGFISGGFPILRQLYSDQAWESLVRDFMVGHQCHSPYFLEISQEFLTYLREEREIQPEDPPFLLELAHYEWVELALDVSEETWPDQQSESMDVLKGKPMVSPLAWKLSYRYPVHLIGPDFQPEQAPEQPTFLIVYRNREDEVKFMESNAMTVRLLDILEGNQGFSGGDALEQLATEIKHPQPEMLLEHGEGLLRQLLALDIICL